MQFSKALFASLTLFTALVSTVSAAFDPNSNKNVVVYWGQASAQFQESLGYYCESDDIDVVIVSFMIDFPGTNGVPGMNLAGACETTFPNGLLNCPHVGEDIKACQAKGKKVLLSLGGAVGNYGFNNDQEAKEFAGVLYNMFLEGSHETRPFGDAVVDGFDLDIENNRPTGYTALVNQLREEFKKGSKDYYIGAAPQCFYPDHSLSEVLENAELDFVYVQFYNNWCNVDSHFNWNEWSDYAKKVSPNKNIKIYLGLPGAKSAAGTGFIDISLVESTVKTLVDDEVFGGVMLWDASQCFSNKVSSGKSYVAAVKDILLAREDSTSTATTSSTKSSTSSTKSSSATVSISTIIVPPAFTISTITVPTFTGTTLSTVVTSWSNSSAPAPTSAPSDAPKQCGPLNGQDRIDCFNYNYEHDFYSGPGYEDCTHSDRACYDGEYVVCVHGTWSTMGCAAGTTCYAYFDDYKNVVDAGCNWPAAGSTTTKKTTSTSSTSTSSTSTSQTKSSTTVSISTIIVPTKASSTVSISTIIVPPAFTISTITVPTLSSSSSAPAATTSEAAEPAPKQCGPLNGQDRIDCFNYNYEHDFYSGPGYEECTHSDRACYDGEYVVCVHGTWANMGCAAGTTCYAYFDDYKNVVDAGCNWPAAGSTTTKKTTSTSSTSKTTTTVAPTTTANATTTSSSTKVSSTVSAPAATTSEAGEPEPLECSSLTGAEQVECLNTNFANGFLNGHVKNCNTGEYACDTYGRLVLCNHGSWNILGCAAGLTCYAFLQGGEAVTNCNWPL